MAEILRLERADEKSLSEINELLRQFNDGKTSLDALRWLIENPMSELWVAVEEGVIIGMATLVFIQKLGGVSTRIEDVVVREGFRGKGIGKTLCKRLIERSKERGAYSIHLTSRPDRVAANELYKKLGFRRHETNAYRMQL